MAREKYKTLTEQMFYILICLQKECCGIDIMEQVRSITKNRVTIGPGTLYTLLADFVKQGSSCSCLIYDSDTILSCRCDRELTKEQFDTICRDIVLK